MPFPNVENSFETFFEPTRIWLFGKPFPTLAYVPSTMTGKTGDRPGTGSDGTHADEFMPYETPKESTPGAFSPLPMPPRRIERKLRRNQPSLQIFARIYSFSFEGHYYKLPRPLLFLVSPGGFRPDDTRAGASNGIPPFNTKLVGIEAKDWQFADDILVWAVDKRDLAVCLDLEVGPYQEVLLDSQVAFEEEMASRGSPGSRGSAASRGSASFRGSILGPHQGR